MLLKSNIATDEKKNAIYANTNIITINTINIISIIAYIEYT